MQDLMEKTVLHIQGRIDVLQRQKDPKEASIKIDKPDWIKI